MTAILRRPPRPRCAAVVSPGCATGSASPWSAESRTKTASEWSTCWCGPRDDQRVELVLRTPHDAPSIPSLAARRLRRPDASNGRSATCTASPRSATRCRARLVRHGHWPRGWYPMRRDAGPPASFEPDIGSFPFLEVEGEGVYEIPVGPVHAGLIEPGHFRFSVVGETILRMKARLWFVHRGSRSSSRVGAPPTASSSPNAISGDTAVGHTPAYAMAVEAAAGHRGRGRRTAWCGRSCWSSNACTTTSPTSARSPTTSATAIVNAHALAAPGNPAAAQQADDRPPAAARRASPSAEPACGSLPDPDDRGRRRRRGGRAGRPDPANSTVRDRFTGTAVLSRDAALETRHPGLRGARLGVDIDARRDHPFVDLGDTLLGRGRDRRRRAGQIPRPGRARSTSRHACSTDLVATTRRRDRARSHRRPAWPASDSGLVEGWRGTIAHRVELDASGC